MLEKQKQNKRNKEKLNTEELKNLQDIEKGMDTLIKSLSKQSLSLDNQVKEALLNKLNLKSN